MEEDVLPPPTLDALVEIADPAPISEAPATPAWTAFFVILALVALTGALLLWRRWRKNAYRRAGLARLDAIVETGDTVALPVLVKAVALEAWPREQVAELSGDPWLAFLDRSLGGGDAFARGPGRALPDLAYGPQKGARLDPDVVRLVRTWIRTHHA